MGSTPSELSAIGYCLTGCPVTHTSSQEGGLLMVGCVLSPHFWPLVIGHVVMCWLVKDQVRAISDYLEHAMEHKTGPRYFLVSTRDHIGLSQSLRMPMLTPSSALAFLGASWHPFSIPKNTFGFW